MALKERDYSNMKETERVQDAIKINSTNVKDYSLKHIINVGWQLSDLERNNHLVRIQIGDQTFMGNTNNISRGVHALVERQDEHSWLPRDLITVKSFGDKTPALLIDTRDVNKECLRDHVAGVTIGSCESVVDLEELLKATRYA